MYKRQVWVWGPADTLTSLAAAGILMTAVNSYAVWDIGFELSFAAVVGKSDDKITMAVTVTKDAQAKGLKAGNLVKEISAIAGGKGGGKPDFAMRCV